MKKKNQIRTVRDARSEKLLLDAELFARGDAAEARKAKKLLKALGLKSERKPHATGLHPRICNLNRWDIDGNPTYYIWQGEDMISSTSVDELMDYLNAETV